MHNTSPVPKYHFLGSADWIKSRWITRLIYATLSQFHYSLVQSLVAPSPFLGPISVKPRTLEPANPQKMFVIFGEYMWIMYLPFKIKWLETVGNTMKYHLFKESEFVPKKSRLECPEWLQMARFPKRRIIATRGCGVSGVLGATLLTRWLVYIIIIIMNDNVHVHVPSFSHISSAGCWKMMSFYSMENIWFTSFIQFPSWFSISMSSKLKWKIISSIMSIIIFKLFIVWFPSFHHFQVSLPLFSIISIIFIEKWVPRGLVSTPGHAFLAGGPRSRLWRVRWCRWSRRRATNGAGNEWFSLFEGVWMGKCLGKSTINVGNPLEM